jgi:2-polyprenyl-3-methyl-5-hydroxy-6-metoxy-1,4-benzoquinol methylase
MGALTRLQAEPPLASRAPPAFPACVSVARSLNRYSAGRVSSRSANEEIQLGERFRFGENWRKFLETVDDERIAEAERSLREALNVSDLRGKRFLDAGCGSGLFSLAALRLGASVRSFDFDPSSTASTIEMRHRFGGNEPDWTISDGSALDADFMRHLGEFDVVYSWGVLHHTGDLDTALSNILIPLAPSGLLYIALYNDQGWRSRCWLRVKQLYCGSKVGRIAVLAVALPLFSAMAVASGIASSGRPWSRFSDFHRKRGMSIYHDWIDWLGGLPYEYASRDAIVDRFEAEGLTTVRVVPTSRWGCNEFVFAAPDHVDIESAAPASFDAGISHDDG